MNNYYKKYLKYKNKYIEYKNKILIKQKGGKIETYTDLNIVNNYINDNLEKYNYIYISLGSAYNEYDTNSIYQAVPEFISSKYLNTDVKILTIMIDDLMIDDLIQKHIGLSSILNYDFIHINRQINIEDIISFFGNLKSKLIKNNITKDKLLICNYITFTDFKKSNLLYIKEKNIEDNIKQKIQEILQIDDDYSESYYIWIGYKINNNISNDITKNYIYKYNDEKQIVDIITQYKTMMTDENLIIKLMLDLMLINIVNFTQIIDYFTYFYDNIEKDGKIKEYIEKYTEYINYKSIAKLSLNDDIKKTFKLQLIKNITQSKIRLILDGETSNITVNKNIMNGLINKHIFFNKFKI